MAEGYFHRLHASTDNRFWVNNPTPAEANAAIAAGAINCTTNPTYAARMLREDPAFGRAAVAQAVQECADDAAAVNRVQELCVARILPIFAPLHDAAPGMHGFVSIQGDPYLEDDANHIVHEAVGYRKLGPNFIAKIPATEAGLAAIDALIRENVPVIFTEVFSIAQATACADLYARACADSGNRPTAFLTHITGIFDEYLAGVAARDSVTIQADLLAQAGRLVARKQARHCAARGAPLTLLGGGARGLHHFTGVLGGDMHVTINWSMAEELLARNPPIEDAIHAPIDMAAVEALRTALPDFAAAWDDEGLPPAAFADYGPVRHFRDSFRKGWDAVRDAVATARTAGSAQ